MNESLFEHFGVVEPVKLALGMHSGRVMHISKVDHAAAPFPVSHSPSFVFATVR